MSKKKRRRKVGRPPSLEGRERHTLTLPPGYLERLRLLGDGNASAAVKKLVDAQSKIV